MSDTPRTDVFHDTWDSYNYPMDAIDFARQLERELAEARKEMYRMAKHQRIDNYQHLLDRAEKAERELAEARKGSASPSTTPQPKRK